MTPEEAVNRARELNATGNFRDEWGYYATYHDAKGEWFVMRRRKQAEVHVAVFVDGSYSIMERMV